MPAMRGVTAVLALGGLLLAACGAAASEDSPHTAQWQRGYEAGLSSRHHYWHRHHHHDHVIGIYCAKNGYNAIQDMSNSVALQWIEGFERACAPGTSGLAPCLAAD